MIRNLEPNQILDGNFKRIIFNDDEYKHRYDVNNHQGVNKNHDLWTGTSY